MDKVQIALQGARNTLEECRCALPLFERRDESSRRLAAKIIITLGRSVTFALQRMNNEEPRFRAWYAPYVEALKNDPLFKYFKDKRNAIVHAVEDVRMNHLTTVSIYDPAPGAIDAVMSDGASIKCVQMDFMNNRRYAVVIAPDGREEERDIKMRSDKPWWENAEVRSFCADAPAEYASVTMVESCKRYLDFLEQMVADAERHFRT